MEPVSEKFGTGKNLVTNIGKIWYRKKSRNQYQKYFVLEKSIGKNLETNLEGKKVSGIKNIWYQKKYQNLKYLVPEKVHIGIKTIWYRKEVRVFVTFLRWVALMLTIKLLSELKTEMCSRQ